MTAVLTRPPTVDAKPARRRMPRRWRHRLTVLSFMAPALIGITVFFIYPLLSAIYFSFTRFDLLTTPQWVGLRNYVYLFTQDPNAQKSALNTLWFVAVLVPARMLAALLTAMLLTSLKRGGGFFRTVFYL